MDKIMAAAIETAALIPEIWSQKFFDQLKNTMPLIYVVNRDYEGEISSLGDTVNISTIPLFSTDAEHIDESQQVDADAVTATSQALVINYRAAKDFKVTDLAKLQSIQFMDKTRDAAVYSILHKMNATLLSLVAASTATPDHYIAFDSGSTLQLADLSEGGELLDTALVPKQDRFVLLGPAQWNDLLAIDKVQSSLYNPNGAPMIDGQLPAQINGFTPLYMSDLGNVCHMFHSSFMTMAVQKQLQTGLFDMGATGARAVRVNSDVLYGAKQLDNKRVVTLY